MIDYKTPIKRILKIIDILKPKLILSSIKLDLNLKDLGIKIIFCEKFSNFKLDINSLNLVQNRHIDTNLDIFSTIASGATLHILPNNEFSFPNLILEYLQRHKISMIFWVSSVLIYFANTKSLDNFNLRYLKKFYFVVR